MGYLVIIQFIHHKCVRVVSECKMRKLTALIIQIGLVFGIISVAHECQASQQPRFVQDNDAIRVFPLHYTQFTLVYIFFFFFDALFALKILSPNECACASGNDGARSRLIGHFRLMDWLSDLTRQRAFSVW